MSFRSLKRVAAVASSAILLSTSAVGSAAAQDVIDLRVVTAFASNSAWERGFWDFHRKVGERLDGRLRLVYVGGPEAIPPFEQIEAIRSGIVHIGTNAGAYFAQAVPEVAAMKLSQVGPAEERENGAYELWRQAIAEKANVHYLGRYHWGVEFGFYSKEPIRSVADFQGRSVRVSQLYRAFVEQMGAVPVPMPHSEIYTSLERGLVSVIGQGNVGIYEQGFHDHLGYIIDPQFYANDQTILVNLDVWNSLPDDVQQILTEIMIEIEEETQALVEREAEMERSALVGAGLEVITLSDADEFLRIGYDAAWDEVLEKSPDAGAELRVLLTR